MLSKMDRTVKSEGRKMSQEARAIIQKLKGYNGNEQCRNGNEKEETKATDQIKEK